MTSVLELNRVVRINRRALAYLLIILAAFVLMYWVLDRGPGISPDSVVYLETAESLRAGEGFVSNGAPMTRFPPLFPLLLATISGLTGPDMIHSARIASSLLFGLNLVLVLALVGMATRNNILAVGITFLLFVTSHGVFTVHSMAWSEPLFIFTLLATFYFLINYLTRPSLRWLLLAAFSSGMAILTRYIGIALIPAVILAILIFCNKPILERTKDAILFSAAALLPITIWVVHNQLTAGTATNRAFAVHPIGSLQLLALVDTVYRFAVPYYPQYWLRLSYLFLVVVFFGLGVASVYKATTAERRTGSNRKFFPMLSLVFILCYVVILCISISFFDAGTPLTERILFPVFILLLLFTVSLTWIFSDVLEKPIFFMVFIVIAISSSLMNGFATYQAASSIYHNGFSFSDRHWEDSQSLALLATFDEDVDIYTNGADLIRFQTGKVTRWIPAVFAPDSGETSESIRSRLDQVCSDTQSGKAVVVLFDDFFPRTGYPTPDELESVCALPLMADLDDGIIFAKVVAQ